MQCIALAKSSNQMKLNKVKNTLKAASVQQVTIYPKIHKDSDERLARKATLITYKGARATLVFCHGFLCDKFDIACFRNMFPAGEYNFLIFDFRAHGQDAEGQVSTLGYDEALDVIAAAEFVHNHPDLKDKPVFAWSFSMGAVAAIEAQAQNSKLFDAMIFDCAFDSSEKLIRQGLDQMRFTLFGYTFDIPGRSLLEKYALHPYVQSFLQKMLKVCAHWDTKHIPLNALPVHPIESIAHISVPCFFIHCVNDEKVPLESAYALYNNVGGYKRLWVTQGRRHFDSFFYNPERYAYKVRKFLHQVLDNSFIDRQQAKIVRDDMVVIT